MWKRKRTKQEILAEKREKVDVDLQLGLISYNEAKKRLEQLNRKES